MFHFHECMDAKLDGFPEGPLFPARIGSLNQMWDCLNWCGAVLLPIGKKIAGYAGEFRPTTSDCYSWFWALSFQTSTGGKVAVLFPWGPMFENNRKRSITVYHDGQSSDAVNEIDRILGEIEDAFWLRYCNASRSERRSEEIPEEIFGRTLADGRKVVPKWYVDVRAHLHPVEGDSFLSWLAAEKWFREQGWEIADPDPSNE